MSAPRVEFRTLRVFLVLAEELHFARCGERVGLTTSRVSQTIRELEEHIGGPLFARTSRSVALTSLGARMRDELAPACAEIDRVLTDARHRARGHLHSVVGELRVGSYLLLNFGTDFTAAIREFNERHPLATVRAVDLGLRRDPLAALRSGDVDALAMRLPISDADLTIGPTLTREDRVIVVARHHPLAALESVSWEDVGDHAVSTNPVVPREVEDTLAPPYTPSGRRISRVAVETFFDIVAMIDSGEVVHPSVPSFLNYAGNPNLVAVPIRDLPPSTTALVWLTNDPPPAVLALARVLESGSTTSSDPHR